VLSACGGSDKPAYCTDVDNFKDAVSGLTDVQITENGISALTAAVDKVESAGKTLVASAKSEFGAQASALSASLTALGATAQQLKDPSSRTAALAAIPAEATAVKSSFDALSSAVKDKCD
jgi:O-acetylhomoserine/O-acetylserine sulfhydrylase-like pyridoxal-dependent enzyme